MKKKLRRRKFPSQKVEVGSCKVLEEESARWRDRFALIGEGEVNR